MYVPVLYNAVSEAAFIIINPSVRVRSYSIKTGKRRNIP